MTTPEPQGRPFDWQTLTAVPSPEERANEEAAVADAVRLLTPCETCGGPTEWQDCEDCGGYGWTMTSDMAGEACETCGGKGGWPLCRRCWRDESEVEA